MAYRQSRRRTWDPQRSLVIGSRFGKLVVREYLGVKDVRPGRSSAFFSMDCDCGRRVERTISYASLRNSCGCGVADSNKRRSLHGCAQRSGHSKEYRAWLEMKRRCNKPNSPGYHRYGGRGIKVCDEWVKDFQAFFRYIGPKPSPTHSVDRIDPDGNYEPGNVRWATPKEQANNRSWHKANRKMG